MTRLYEEARQLFVSVLSSTQEVPGKGLRPLAVIMLAFLDGLGVQQLIDPDLDASEALSAMERMITLEFREIAAGAQEDVET